MQIHLKMLKWLLNPVLDLLWNLPAIIMARKVKRLLQQQPQKDLNLTNGLIDHLHIMQLNISTCLDSLDCTLTRSSLCQQKPLRLMPSKKESLFINTRVTVDKILNFLKRFLIINRSI